MNTSKHTPGPWTAQLDYTGNSFHIFSDCPSREVQKWREQNPEKTQDSWGTVTVARVSQHFNGSGSKYGPDDLIDMEEVTANAQLLATAPDLLKALQKLWGFVEDLGKSNPGYLGKLVLQDYGRMNEAFLETELVLKKLQ